MFPNFLLLFISGYKWNQRKGEDFPLETDFIAPETAFTWRLGAKLNYSHAGDVWVKMCFSGSFGLKLAGFLPGTENTLNFSASDRTGLVEHISFGLFPSHNVYSLFEEKTFRQLILKYMDHGSAVGSVVNCTSLDNPACQSLF